MGGQDWLAERFEGQRGHLRAVAHRMLGSDADADDAVQETWLRLSRSDTSDVDNLAGWLTTVLTRVCLDVLRSRRTRREHPAGPQQLPEPPGNGHGEADPEHEAVLADSVGRALLVVLETLSPAERVAFVLHDMFAVPFDRIAAILERSPGAAKKLAARARRKVHLGAEPPEADLLEHRRVVEAFLAALRAGDVDALLNVLAPDVVRRVDPAAAPPGVPVVVRGARAVVEEARTRSQPARRAEAAVVNGSPGAVVTERGRLGLALRFTIEDGLITEFEVISDPARLSRLTVIPFA